MNIIPKFGQPGYKSTWKPKGNQTRTGRTRESLEVRFWKKVQLPEDRSQCWLWTGSKNGNGYGQIWSSEMGDPANIVAHHASLRIHGIEIPEGRLVDHMCRKRLCVNPAHLRFVDAHTNAVQNNDSPFAQNYRREKCIRGHPFTPENTALTPLRQRRTKAGKLVTPKGFGRTCLTCRPYSWRNAIIPRARPLGSAYLPTDPDYDQRPGAKTVSLQESGRKS